MATTTTRGLKLAVFETKSSGLSIPSVVQAGVTYAVFALAMIEVGAIGKHDWRIALEEEGAGKMLPVRFGEETISMLCVPIQTMVMTIINMVTMPEWDWMDDGMREHFGRVGFVPIATGGREAPELVTFRDR
jgi:hypothetical protein